MRSSHHSITLNALKNNDLSYVKTQFSFFLSVTLDSKVHFYVLIWSPRQQYVFFQCINYFMQQHASSIFHI